MPKPWAVTGISNSAVLREFRGVAAVQGEPLRKTSLGGATHRGFCFVLIIFSNRCRFRLARERAPFQA